MELFELKYRPSTIDGLVLPDEIKARFKNGIQTNYLFGGESGVGKTSLALALVKQYGHDYKIINASTYGRIDMLRDVIEGYAKTFSFKNNLKKVVILDEADGSSDKFFDGLRAIMNDVMDNCLFIIIYNYSNKIPSPIRSRVDFIDFSFDHTTKEMVAGYMRHIASVVKAEDMQMGVHAIKALVDRYAPDVRQMMITLQRLKVQFAGERITVNAIDSLVDEIEELFNVIVSRNPPEENYTYIVKNFGNRIDEVMQMIASKFIEYLIQDERFHTAIPAIVRIVNEYQYKHAFVMVKMTNVLACIYEIQTLISKCKI